MDAFLRQPTFLFSQWEAFLSRGLFDKTTLQIVPKKDYRYVQVIYKYIVNFTIAFISVLISVLCLTVNLTVKFKNFRQ